MEVIEYLLAGFVALTALTVFFPAHVLLVAWVLYQAGRNSKNNK
jgi:hypothetical protein